MPFNGSGAFSVYTPGNPVVTGTTISSTVNNNTNSDFATGLSTCITKNGQTTITANLPMSNFKHTGVGAASATTDYARADQVQNSTLTYLTSVSGTNTITANAGITPAAYVAGQQFHFIPANNNTGATTLNVSGLGAGAVQRNGAALASGALLQNVPAVVVVTTATPVFELVSSFTTTPVAAGAITTSGLTMSTARLLGRTTASTGAVEEISVAASLTLSGGSLSGTAASDTQAGVIEVAVQSEMETATSTTLAVTPGRQQYHPGMCKGWINANGSTAAANASYNVSGTTDQSTGILWVSWGTDFSSANHVCLVTIDVVSSSLNGLTNVLQAGIDVIECRNTASGALTDPNQYSVAAFGDQ